MKKKWYALFFVPRFRWLLCIQSAKLDDVSRESFDWVLPIFETEYLEYKAGEYLIKVVFAYMFGSAHFFIPFSFSGFADEAHLLVYLISFTILSLYLSYAPVSGAMSTGQYHPAAWAIIHTIEAFNNAGTCFSVFRCVLVLCFVYCFFVCRILAVTAPTAVRCRGVANFVRGHFAGQRCLPYCVAFLCLGVHASVEGSHCMEVSDAAPAYLLHCDVPCTSPCLSVRSLLLLQLLCSICLYVMSPRNSYVCLYACESLICLVSVGIEYTVATDGCAGHHFTAVDCDDDFRLASS